MSELHQALAREALRLLPRFDKEGQLSDHAMTAWQFGCMSLVAMGVAEERRYGCELTLPKEKVLAAIHPDRLWFGDAGFAFLALGSQSNHLRAIKPQAKKPWSVRPSSDFLDSEGRIAFPTELLNGPDGEKFQKFQQMLRAHQKRVSELRTIQPFVESDLTYHAHPSFLVPLQNIGWIADDRWTEASQQALWRYGSAAIPDAELDEAAESARAGLPKDVSKAIDSIWAPPPMDRIARRARDWWERDRRWIERRPKGARYRVRGPETEEEMCDVMIQRWPEDAFGEVVGLFEYRWRLSLGWDSGAPLIPLFNDRLANAVAKVVSET